MTFAQGLIETIAPVLIGWIGVMVYIVLGDHGNRKDHERRIVALEKMGAINHTILVRFAIKAGIWDTNEPS